jgi:tetratricopeptide (TPR) repeat protein
MRSTHLIIAGFLIFVAFALWSAWRLKRAAETTTPEATQAETPQRVFRSPYRNTYPGVSYIGDEACAQCHPGQAETYRQHPMGRSLLPIASLAFQQRYDPAVHNPFEAGGLQFLVERRGDHVYHKQRQRDSLGQVVEEWQAEVRFALGSGAHGYCYLIDHDGYLFVSAICWYSQKEVWDLAPALPPAQFTGRPIGGDCVVCHCNHAEPVPNTINRFRTPIFQGYAIGCERCHGPGQLHLERRERGEVVEGDDDSIVNPARLEPALREAVCEQCHLQGEARLLRRGRQLFDYRPGLPLHEFWSVFVRRPEFTDNAMAVNQVLQMHDSQCSKGSKGRLGCISCHDPHALPDAQHKAAFYRERCLRCHQQAGCSLSATVRRAKNQDDCAACHMPRSGSSNISHTALTDHRVLRRPTPAVYANDQLPTWLLADSPLRHFHEDLLDRGTPDANRDLGLALVELARKNPRAARSLGPTALPLLTAATTAHPEDIKALEGKAAALASVGRSDAALATYDTVLTHVSEDENALAEAAKLAATLGRTDAAIGYLRRLLAVNPWVPLYYVHLAKLHATRRQWPEAVRACQAALRLDPLSVTTRYTLVGCLIRSGQKDQARAEFAKLLALNPPEPDVLRQWFDQQMQ